MRIPAKKVFLEPFLLVGVSGRQNCTPVRSGAKRLSKERFGGSPAATKGRLKCSECPSSRDSRCWDWALAPSRGYHCTRYIQLGWLGAKCLGLDSPWHLFCWTASSNMGLPFLSRQAKRRDQIVAIDLGGRTTKAVYLQRRGDKLNLAGFAVLDAPLYEKTFSLEILAEHLKAVSRALGNGKARHVTLALGVNDTLFRQVELPLMATSDLRLMLKYNSKNYLQQYLPDHVFDCYYLGAAAVKGDKAAPGQQKQRAMVGAAKKQVV